MRLDELPEHAALSRDRHWTRAYEIQLDYQHRTEAQRKKIGCQFRVQTPTRQAHGAESGATY